MMSEEGPSIRDYVGIALDYAREANDDKKGVKHGEMIRLAAKRFLNDYARCGRSNKDEGTDSSCPYYFRAATAVKYCQFIEMLPHVEGKWKTRNLFLEPAQLFFVVQMFGFRNKDGTGRRFTTALFAVARKNAKSTLAAAILIALSALEKEEGFQTISAATTGSQARIVWRIAKRMIDKTPEIKELFHAETYGNHIEFFETGGTIKPINAKASTQDGLNPTYTNLDELHAHESHDLLNVLSSAAGGRRSPLFLYTTTEGYENPGPWPEQRNFAEAVLNGAIEADHYLAIIFRLDDKDDDFDESKWIKANPLMESNPLLLTNNRKLAIEAKAMPGKLAEFRIKRLNRRASTSQGEINLIRWLECKGKVDLKKLEGKQCWGSLDLATVTDMAAWRLLWLVDEDEKTGERIYVTWGRFWVPSEQVKLRTTRNTVPYAGWVAGKQIQQTPGEVIDYAMIKKDVKADCARFNPEQVAFDPWNAGQLSGELTDMDIPMVQFIQGTKSYQPAFKAFERAYLHKRLTHEDNKALNWNMSNLVARKDANSNRAPDRKKSKEKIDGAVCLLMCFGLAEVQEQLSYVTGNAVIVR